VKGCQIIPKKTKKAGINPNHFSSQTVPFCPNSNAIKYSAAKTATIEISRNFKPGIIGSPPPNWKREPELPYDPPRYLRDAIAI
jgi:hypothetical protein